MFDQFLKDLDKWCDPAGLRAPDTNIAAIDFIQRMELLDGFVSHRQNVLGTLSQEHPLFCQTHAVIAAGEQFLSQLLLQFFDLAGQGGL